MPGWTCLLHVLEKLPALLRSTWYQREIFHMHIDDHPRVERTCVDYPLHLTIWGVLRGDGRYDLLDSPSSSMSLNMDTIIIISIIPTHWFFFKCLLSIPLGCSMNWIVFDLPLKSRYNLAAPTTFPKSLQVLGDTTAIGFCQPNAALAIPFLASQNLPGLEMCGQKNMSKVECLVKRETTTA